MRTLVILVVLAIWVIAPPLAEASGACVGMSGMCEGPCATASCTGVLRVADAILPPVADIVAQARDQSPSAPLRLPDLPPRP
jgi:hypothetical protein